MATAAATKKKPATTAKKKTTAVKKPAAPVAKSQSKLTQTIDPQFSLLAVVAVGLLGIIGVLLWNAVINS